MKKTEGEDRFAMTKLIIDAFGPVLTIVGILVGIYTFTREERKNNEKEQDSRKYNGAIEFKRKTWEKQQEIYFVIAEMVGQIVEDDSDGPGKKKAITEFKRLYYGKAVFVEDSSVARSMRTFNEGIIDYNDHFQTQDYLKKTGFELIENCKQSSSKTWKTLTVLP